MKVYAQPVAPSPIVRPIDTARIFPEGAIRNIYRPVQPLVERLLGLPQLWRLYDEARADCEGAQEFSQQALRVLGVQAEIEPALLTVLKKEGPVVLCANHPFGGIEFFALVQALENARTGAWSFMGNEVVCAIPEVRSFMIPVFPFGKRPEHVRKNRTALMDACRTLKKGGLVGLFPAGRVSFWRHDLNAVCDGDWTDHPMRIAHKLDASIVVVNIPGHNSKRFLSIPRTWRTLRALLLARELSAPPCRTVSLRLAAEYSPADVRRLMRKAKQPSRRLHADVYVRADSDVERPVESPESKPQTMAPLAEAVPQNELEREWAALGTEHTLVRHADFDVMLCRGRDAPALMRELGIRREYTFRKAGQGTGLACDLSPEDVYYHHLMLWDRKNRQLAGAYRIGMVEEIITTQGTGGLYLDHIFDLKPGFYDALGPAFELSRSFVMPDYQRDNRALLALWKGLAAAAIRHDVHTFFGSVTISNAHHPASRAILVEFLKREYAEHPSLARHVQARRPFSPATTYHTLIAEAFTGEPIDSLDPLIRRIEADARGIPPLMRYYCALGARYSAYHVESSFQDALYCLLRVDMRTIPDAYRRRLIST